MTTATIRTYSCDEDGGDDGDDDDDDSVGWLLRELMALLCPRFPPAALALHQLGEADDVTDAGAVFVRAMFVVRKATNTVLPYFFLSSLHSYYSKYYRFAEGAKRETLLSRKIQENKQFRETSEKERTTRDGAPWDERIDVFEEFLTDIILSSKA